jgi:hypothetical protein
VLLLRHTLAALLDHGAHTTASRTDVGYAVSGDPEPTAPA